MQISVITSAYNAEKTIEEAVTSVAQQSYADFEHIVVNHGSTDKTGDILKRLMGSDARLKIIELGENTGKIGRAVNVALNVAKGRYITFLDADDAYNKDYLQNMHGYITQDDYDVAVCGSLRMDENGNELLRDTIDRDIAFGTDHAYQNLPQLINKAPTRYFTVWWNKLYSAEYLKKHSMLMSEKTLVHGDALFNLSILMQMPKMYCAAYVGTRWRQTKGSVSFGTYKKAYRPEIMEVCEAYFTLFEQCGASADATEQLADKLLATVATLKRLQNYNATAAEVQAEIEMWERSGVYKKMADMTIDN